MSAEHIWKEVYFQRVAFIVVVIVGLVPIVLFLLWLAGKISYWNKKASRAKRIILILLFVVIFLICIMSYYFFVEKFSPVGFEFIWPRAY